MKATSDGFVKTRHSRAGGNPDRRFPLKILDSRLHGNDENGFFQGFYRQVTSKSLIFFLTGFAFLILLSSCTFPRLYVLKDPLTAEEHLNLGVSYEEKGELDNAIKEYRLASKKLPLAYLYLGNVHFLKKEWAEAEKYYKEAIQKDPQNADAYNNLAWLYYTKGENLKEAEDLASKSPGTQSLERNDLPGHPGKDKGKRAESPNNSTSPSSTF